MSDSIDNNHPVGGDQLDMNESEMDTPLILWGEENRILDIQNIRKLVFQGKYEFSKHAERERELDMIYV